MDNTVQKHNQLLSLFKVGLCLLCMLMIGCGSRRDIPTDPAISPIIVPDDLRYEEQIGAVVLDWEYLGIHPPTRFRFLRVERDGIQFLNWKDLPAPTRMVNEGVDVWEVDSVMDDALKSGEDYGYIMRTETDLKRPSEEPLGRIQIPGARIEDIVLAPEKNTATLVWHLPAGTPQKLELLRQINDDVSQVVSTLNNFSDTTFVDVLLEGNAAYRYVLRNTMDHSVVLESRAFVMEAYPRLALFQESEPVNTHLFLTPSRSVSSALLALVATESFFAVRDLSVVGYIINPRELPVQNHDQFNFRSLSLAVTPIGRPSTSLKLLAGVLPETKAVQLAAFFSEDDVFVETSWQYADWFVSDPQASTAVFVGPDGTIWVGVEKVLRAFVAGDDGVVEVGQFSVDFSGDIHSLAVFESGIWVVTTNGQVWRSSPTSGVVDGGGTLVWEQVVLPVDAYPIGVSGNDKVVFVLDKTQGRVLGFDFDGQPGLWWRGLDDLNLDSGGLAVSRTGDVYVWDALNQMALFKNTPAFLEPFPEPEF